MGQIFKLGEKVFHYEFGGWGKVIEEYNINKNPFPIVCRFPNGQASFTWDGRYYENYPPTLSFTEYVLAGFSQQKPMELPNVGEAVWVRDHEFGNWNVSMFLEYDPTEKGGPYIVTSTFIEGDHECYRYMTTKNPYANEHN